MTHACGHSRVHGHIRSGDTTSRRVGWMRPAEFKKVCRRFPLPSSAGSGLKINAKKAPLPGRPKRCSYSSSGGRGGGPILRSTGPVMFAAGQLGADIIAQIAAEDSTLNPDQLGKMTLELENALLGLTDEVYNNNEDEEE